MGKKYEGRGKIKLQNFLRLPHKKKYKSRPIPSHSSHPHPIAILSIYYLWFIRAVLRARRMWISQIHVFVIVIHSGVGTGSSRVQLWIRLNLKCLFLFLLLLQKKEKKEKKKLLKIQHNSQAMCVYGQCAIVALFFSFFSMTDSKTQFLSSTKLRDILWHSFLFQLMEFMCAFLLFSWYAGSSTAARIRWVQSSSRSSASWAVISCRCRCVFLIKLSLNYKRTLFFAGESGKSTFLKQMRIIHGIKFEPELIREFHHVICQNIIKGECWWCV